MRLKYDKNIEKLIIQKANPLEYRQLKSWLTRLVDGYRFNPRFQARVWNGTATYFEDGQIQFGLWREVLKAMEMVEGSFVLENKEDFPLDRSVTLEGVDTFCKEFFKDHKVRCEKTGNWIPFMPHDYQIASAFKILKNRYCLAEIATSGGKSLVISIVYFYTKKFINPDAKMLFIVPNISLVTQMYNDMLNYYYGENNLATRVDYNLELILDNGDIITHHPHDILLTAKGEKSAGEVIQGDMVDGRKVKRIIKSKLESDLRIEEIMSDQPRIYAGEQEPNVYIGCYQSLEKWNDEFFKQFHMVATDEAHKAKATTIKKILIRTFGHAYCRFGVSGTFPKEDSFEILTIQYLMGPIIASIEAKELMDRGKITPVQIYSLVLNHNRPDIHKKLKSARNPNNGGDIYNIEKGFIQASEPRLNFIKKLVESKCTKNSMVLFQNIEYGQRIYEKLKEIEGIDVYYIDGSVKNKERTAIIKQMKQGEGRVKILVSSYQTTATGLSINAIHNCILCDSYKSEQIVVQTIGRALRKYDGKVVANIYDLTDILDPTDMTNVMYRQYLEREKYYKSRQYPYVVKKLNL